MGINFLSNLFLANTMNLGLAIELIIGGVRVALVRRFFVGMFINNKRTEKRLGDVQTRTKNCLCIIYSMGVYNGAGKLIKYSI